MKSTPIKSRYFSTKTFSTIQKMKSTVNINIVTPESNYFSFLNKKNILKIC